MLSNYTMAFVLRSLFIKYRLILLFLVVVVPGNLYGQSVRIEVEGPNPCSNDFDFRVSLIAEFGQVSDVSWTISPATAGRLKYQEPARPTASGTHLAYLAWTGSPGGGATIIAKYKSGPFEIEKTAAVFFKNTPVIQTGVISGVSIATPNQQYQYSFSASSISNVTGYQWFLNGGNLGYTTSTSFDVSFSTAGTHTVECRPLNSCNQYNQVYTKQVVVGCPNVTATITGSQQYCQGNSTVLSAQPASGYSFQWRLNGNVIDGATQSTYSASAAGQYTVTLVNGACSYSSTPHTLNEVPAPDASITGAEGLCSGQSIDLSTPANEQYSYQWKKDGSILPNASAHTISVSTAGNYSVDVTMGQCTRTASKSVVASTPPAAITAIKGLNKNFEKELTLHEVEGANDATSFTWSVSEFIPVPGGQGQSEVPVFNDAGGNVPRRKVRIAELSAGAYKFKVIPVKDGCEGTPFEISYTSLSKALKPIGNYVDMFHPELNLHSLGYLFLPKHSANYAGCSTLGPVDLRIALDQGEVYNLGKNPFSASANVTVTAYSDIPGQIQEWTFTLSVSQDAPEQVFMKTITLQPELVKFIAIKVNSYTAPNVAAQNTIRLRASYEETQDVVDVSTLTVTPISAVQDPANLRWEQTFTWTPSCTDIPDYIFQLVKQYGTNGLNVNDPQVWKDALQIQTESSASSVTLSMAEGSGTYYWRVIPLGNKPGGIANPENWGTPSSAVKFEYTHPEDNKNWIYSRTFTEGNHITEQVTYANGLQQIAQQQTRIQDENRIVATQTIQDFIGRNAVSSLPIPVAGLTSLGYQAGLLKNTAGNTYSAADFDGKTPEAAVDLGGYYSGVYNDDQNQGVASAEGYPFSQTIFTPDATGRVREQGGVGFTHSIKGGKTVRTFYTKATETELLSLFGSEAPDANSVQKIITYDANGTASVSFQTKDGKVIATALAVTGSTGSLSQLTPPPTVKDYYQEVKGNRRVDDITVVSQTPLFVETDGTVTIDYEINPGQIMELCGSSSNGQVGNYPLEGNANDISGRNNHGSGVGLTPSIDALGRASGAYSFDGTASYISVADGPDMDFGNRDFTVSFWVNRKQNTSGWDNSGGVNKWNSSTSPSTNEWGLHLSSTASNNTPGFFVESGVTTYQAVATSSLALNTWYHLVGIRSGNQLKIYVNGVLEGTGTLPANAAVNNVGRVLNIGRVGSAYTAAAFDDVQLYSRALTDDEVKQLLQRGTICKTCDYTVSLRLFKEGDTAPIDVMAPYSIAGGNCSGYAPYNPGSVPVTLTGGVNYVLEKRLTLQNQKTTTQTYIDAHLQEVETYYRAQMSDRISIINGFIANHKYTELYSYLASVGTLDQANNQYIVPLMPAGSGGCAEYIFIPVLETCPPEQVPGEADCSNKDFEKYFKDYYSDNTSVPVLRNDNTLAYAYFRNQNLPATGDQKVYFASGQLNTMLENLIAEYPVALPCSTIWKIWKREVAAYEATMNFTPNADGLTGADAANYNGDKDYFSAITSEYDMVGSFLSALEGEMQKTIQEQAEGADFCAAANGKFIKRTQLYGSYNGITVSPDLAHIYRLVYYNDSSPEQRMALKFYANYSEEQIRTASVIPTTSDFEGLSDCDKFKFALNTKPGGLGSGVTSDEAQIQKNITQIREKCGQACEGRIEEFRQAIINSLFTQNPATVIEHYYVYRDDTYHKDDIDNDIKVRAYVGVYDVERNTSGYTISQCELDAMAQALVDNCKNNYCNTPLTPVDQLYPGKTVSARKFGTEEELLKIKKAMTYDFEVQVNQNDQSCGTEWDNVEKRSSGWLMGKVILQSSNFVNGEVRYSNGHYYIDGTLPAFGSLFFNDGTSFSNTDEYLDYVLLKIDPVGNIVWKKQIISESLSSSNTAGRAASSEGGGESYYSYIIDENNGDIIFTGSGGCCSVNSFPGSNVKLDGSVILTLSNSYQGYIGKFSSDGNLIWIKEHNGIGSFYSGRIVKNDDNLYNVMPIQLTDKQSFKICKRSIDNGIIDNLFNSDEVAFSLTGTGSYSFSFQGLFNSSDGFYVGFHLVNSGSGGINRTLTINVNGNSRATHTYIAPATIYAVFRFDLQGKFQSVNFFEHSGVAAILLHHRNGVNYIVGVDGESSGQQSMNFRGEAYALNPKDIFIIKQNNLNDEYSWGGAFSWAYSNPNASLSDNVSGDLVFSKFVKTENTIHMLKYNFSTNQFTTSSMEDVVATDKMTILNYAEESVEKIIGFYNFYPVKLRAITLSTNTATNKIFLSQYKSTCSHPGLCFRFTDSMIKPIVIPTEMQNHTYNPVVQTCEEVSANVLSNTVDQQVEQIINRRVRSFREQYYHTCGDPSLINDKLTVTYKTGLHHFTLYYYDRAGNLVRTVPPEGVVPLKVGTNAEIAIAKAYPAVHNLVTEYQYNTLGQLIREHSPDANFESDNENTGLYRKPSYTPSGNLTWASRNAVTVTGSSVIKNAGAQTGWNAGAISEESILKDGFVEWQFTGSARFRVMGLSQYNISNDYTSVDYGIFTHINGEFYVYEKGADRGRFGRSFSATDKFRVERVGNTIYYKRNGEIFHTSTVPSTGALHVDCAISLAYGSIENIVFSNILSEAEKESADNTANQALNESRYYATYIYNDKGQLRFSRNAKQKKEGTFSYTKYDELGRVIEVGESTIYNEDVLMANRNAVGRSTYPTEGKRFVTSTFYTEPYTNISDEKTALPAGYAQAANYLRNRVSYTYLDKDAQDNTLDDRTYTVYNYDAHGNVDWLVQIIPGMLAVAMKYEYDLISGKVTQVSYNPGKRDEFYHRYDYDANNRLSKVQTSKEGKLWETEARYEYYMHGPLKRAEIGEDFIQGVDYTYTIHGWLKGLNHQLVDKTSDPGQDAVGSSVIGRDAFGMALGYYAGDYKGTYKQFEVTNTSNLQAYQGKNLYNGNISAWSTGILYPTESGISYPTTANAFTYDVLNRLTSSLMYTYASGAYTRATSFDNSYTYSANGNILTTAIYRDALTLMDQTTYNYIAGTNRLSHVDDAIASSPVKNDIEDQAVGNYTYDAIGNLIKDVQQQTVVSWNPYGKVERVDKVDASNSLTGVNTAFLYDAAGNRVAKKRINAAGLKVTDYYVRDASGNVMATYEKTEQAGSTPEIILNDLYIYGSDRLGSYNRARSMDGEEGETLLESGETRIAQNTTKTHYESISYLVNAGSELTLGPGFIYTAGTGGDDFTVRVGIAGNAGGLTPDIYSRSLNSRRYELKDHLGNIRVVVTDLKLSTLVSNAPGDYRADITETYNYYPFGMDMSGRSWFANTKYRYGFNGKEKDDSGEFGEIQYDYGFRIYNPAVGRFLSVDPLIRSYPQLTPYQFASNNSVRNIDVDGLEGGSVIEYTFTGVGQELEAAWNRKSYEFKLWWNSWSILPNSPTSNSTPSSTPNKPAPPVKALTLQTQAKKVDAVQVEVTVNTNMNKPNNFTIEDAKNGLQVVNEKYGEEVAITVERMYRLETNHFKSKQYRLTGTGGMEAHGDGPYYGWSAKFFEANPQYKPTGITGLYEGSGLSSQGGNAQIKDKPKQFVVMPSVEAGMMFKADYFERYDGNYARWFSTDPEKQEIYRKTLSNIKPRIVQSFKNSSTTTTP